jgi:hypothetical protein
VRLLRAAPVRGRARASGARSPGRVRHRLYVRLAQSEVVPLERRHLDLEAGTLRLDPRMTKNAEGRVGVYLTDAPAPRFPPHGCSEHGASRRAALSRDEARRP